MHEIRIPGLRRVLRISWSEDTMRKEIHDEIAFHIEARVEELVKLGASPAEARRRAEAEFGDVSAAERELSVVDRRRAGKHQRAEILMSLFDDIRYAARSLMKRPALLIVTTIALSVGIAANAVMFGIVDQLLIQPPALVAAPDDVVRVYYRQRGFGGEMYTSGVTTYRVIARLRDEVKSFAQVSAMWRNSMTLGRGVQARQVEVEMVSANYFSLLGVLPHRGRLLTPDDDRIPVGAHVAVLSAGFAQQQFGDSGAVGRTVLLQGKPFDVVGVAPSGFSGVNKRRVDLWIPISALANDFHGPEWHNKDNSWWTDAIARIAPGTTADAAALEATRWFRGVQREWRSDNPRADTLGSVVLGSILPTRGPEGLTAESKVSLWVLGVSVIVLLIACANVANLLIARTWQRRREIAVRLAMGVSRWRLARLLLAEAALLAALGSAVALLLAFAAGPIIQRLLLTNIAWNARLVDARVMAITLVAMVLCVLLAGVAPALQGLGTKVSESLKAAQAQVAGGRSRLRFTLLVLQAALSVVLLVGAGLFMSSLRKVNGKDVGIDLDRVLLVHMRLGQFGFSTPQSDAIHEAAVARLAGIPGVERTTLVRQTVPMRSANGISFRPFGRDSAVRFALGGPYYGVVDANFFPTVGATLLRGRNFTSSEERGTARVAIVNKTLADGYWPNADPVGSCVRLGSDSTCTIVVGVVEDLLTFALVKDERALVYLTPAHPAFGNKPAAAVLLRVSDNPTSVAALVRREVQQLAPNMPFVQVDPYAHLVEPQLRPWRLGATMFGLYGLIALVIAAVGLYSVMAYWVSQRTHEIGVRMALGARRGDVVRMVALQSSRAVLLGIIVGSALAAFGARWVADMLYETSPHDGLVYAIAALALAAASIVAAVIPTHRSTRVDPALAIRTE